MVAFFPFVLGFHGTLHPPGRARSRQEMQASHACPPAPVKWWRVEGKEKKEGDSGRLALGKGTFGKEMAFGKNARI